MVTNTALVRSDDPDQIYQCSEILSKSNIRLRVFKSIYTGQRKERSVEMVVSDTKLDEKQVRKALRELSDHHMAIVNGRGKSTIIEKDSFCRKYRDKIINAAENPRYREKLEVKRRKPASRNSNTAKFHPKATTTGTISKRSSKSRSTLRIACLTTNPSQDLRTDVEARVIKKSLQSSLNREKIEIEHLAAATFEDLLQSINIFKPHLIHFSGHGNDGSILFDNEAHDQFGLQVDYGILREAIMATDSPPKLLILSSCFSSINASDLLEAVPAVVAMKDALDDTAAAIFSKQFYSAIFAGQSVASAVSQAKALLRAGDYPDAELPEIIARPLINPKELTFLS